MTYHIYIYIYIYITRYTLYYALYNITPANSIVFNSFLSLCMCMCVCVCVCIMYKARAIVYFMLLNIYHNISTKKTSSTLVQNTLYIDIRHVWIVKFEKHTRLVRTLPPGFLPNPRWFVVAVRLIHRFRFRLGVYICI